MVTFSNSNIRFYSPYYLTIENSASCSAAKQITLLPCYQYYFDCIIAFFDWKAITAAKKALTTDVRNKKSLRVFLMQFIYIAKNLTCTMIIIGYFLSDVVPVCIG